MRRRVAALCACVACRAPAARRSGARAELHLGRHRQHHRDDGLQCRHQLVQSAGRRAAGRRPGSPRFSTRRDRRPSSYRRTGQPGQLDLQRQSQSYSISGADVNFSLRASRRHLSTMPMPARRSRSRTTSAKPYRRRRSSSRRQHVDPVRHQHLFSGGTLISSFGTCRSQQRCGRHRQGHAATAQLSAVGPIISSSQQFQPSATAARQSQSMPASG